jgi:hypothetical protein
MMVKDVVFFLKHAFLEIVQLAKTAKTEQSASRECLSLSF